MSKVAFGVKSIKKGGINTSTGLAENLVNVGDVYRDTATLTQEDGETTDHYSEFKNDPVVTITEPGETTLEFSLMDTEADVLVQYLGGTVTTVSSVKSWNKPSSVPDIEASFELETIDGTKFTINRAKVSAKINGELARKGITLLEVKARVLTPKVASVPPLVITDPA